MCQEDVYKIDFGNWFNDCLTKFHSDLGPSNRPDNLLQHFLNQHNMKGKKINKNPAFHTNTNFNSMIIIIILIFIFQYVSCRCRTFANMPRNRFYGSNHLFIFNIIYPLLFKYLSGAAVSSIIGGSTFYTVVFVFVII